MVREHIGFPLFVDRNTDLYFDSIGMEYIPQEINQR